MNLLGKYYTKEVPHTQEDTVYHIQTYDHDYHTVSLSAIQSGGTDTDFTQQWKTGFLKTDHDDMIPTNNIKYISPNRTLSTVYIQVPYHEEGLFEQFDFAIPIGLFIALVWAGIYLTDS